MHFCCLRATRYKFRFLFRPISDYAIFARIPLSNARMKNGGLAVKMVIDDGASEFTFIDVGIS